MKLMKNDMTKFGTSLFNKLAEGEYEDLSKEMMITPLHLAFNQQNNKSVNMILKYLAKLDYT